MPDGETTDALSEPPERAEAAPSTGEALPGEKEIIDEWRKKIKAARKHWRPVFQRMRKCQKIATHGAYDEWLADEARYVVPIVMRHINQAVSQLYAKNPTAIAEHKERMLHTVWDGTQEQIHFLTAQAMIGDAQAEMQLNAVQQDIAQAQIQVNLAERAAKTLTLLYQHQVDEQPFVFKTKIKQLVRRAKVNGVGYVKLNPVRETEMRPEATAMMEDTQSKLKLMERLEADLANSSEHSDETREAAAAQLATLQNDLAEHPDRVVREQIVFDYPKSTEIVLDPDTRDLKTLEGCGWLVHDFDLTAARIKDIYGVDIEARRSESEQQAFRLLEKDGQKPTYRVCEIQDKYGQQVATICEGYDRFLRRPHEPAIWIEGFFNIFPLVFNEVENDEEIYPLSDVWAARHMQFEYNRAREARREHRIAARPFWMSRRGRLEEQEKARLREHAAHEIVEINSSDPKERISDIVERGPTAVIDPNLYEVDSVHTDMQRTVGSQEANLGGTSGATATESSIAESSRMSSLSDNVDDLDDMLSLLARRSGQVLLQFMSKERVIAIVGPGAVWPEMDMTRKQLADEITLSVKAGSSGRPNQAAKLANMERAWPALSQIPGIDAEPIAETYFDLLDIDYDSAKAKGAMSIVAQNALSGPAPAGSAPAAQGGQGANGGRRAGGTQPEYPGDSNTNAQ